jgi:rod shape-determining protein MreD
MRQTNILVVFFTLTLALVFQLFPWSGLGIHLRPDFILVALLYWVLRAPHLCNIGIAWLAGFLVDLASGSLLGQHALAFTATAFLALLYQRRLVLFNRAQLAAYVLVLLIAARILILLLKLFAGNEAPDWKYFLPIVSSMLLWQLFVVLFGSPTRPKR